MAGKYVGNIDLRSFELRNAVLQNLAAEPSSPLPGRMFFNTQLQRWGIYTSAGWYYGPPDATTTIKGLVQLAGDLAGTAAAPAIAAKAVTLSKIADALRPSQGAANGDEALRAIGTAGGTAAAGNDARLSDARPPSGPAGGDLTGSYPNPTLSAATRATLRDRSTHTGTQVAATISDFDTQVRNSQIGQLATPTAAVSLGGQRILNLGQPILSTDATTKAYVDGIAQGLDAKQSVLVASTGNMALTGVATPPTVDGVVVPYLSRLLLKDQTNPAENGIYTQDSDDTQQLLRAVDFNVWAEVPSAFVFVEQGTTQADTGWTSTANQGGTLGTTAIPWVQFSGAGQIVAGNGLTKTGNTLDVLPDGASIEVVSDQVRVKDAGITAAKLAPSSVNLSVGSTTTTGVLPLAKGGTGGNTSFQARTNIFAAGFFTNNGVHAAGASISVPAGTHGLGAGRAKKVAVYEVATGDEYEVENVNVAANGDVVVTFGSSQAANAWEVVILGAAS